MESGLSSNTVKKHHNMLLTAFKVAVKQDILNVNVVEKVEPPKMVRKEAEFYTTAEIQELFKRIKGDKLEVAVKLAAFLGLRREELCGLRWENIDFYKRKIFIKEQERLLVLLLKKVRKILPLREHHLYQMIYMKCFLMNLSVRRKTGICLEKHMKKQIML